MRVDISEIKVTTPGRVCLFGEHQDYLNLPIIACAISLRIEITGTKREDSLINIYLPDINQIETFSLRSQLEYLKDRDYFKSSINVLKKNGFKFSKGFDCVIHSEIPINAGTSSSSALIVSWISFLNQFSDSPQKLSSEKLAQYAHEAEVMEFDEPGGMMDHYSTAVGGIIYLHFNPTISLEKINSELGAFVLGDSLEPKDTKYILGKVKEQVISITNKLNSNEPSFSLMDISESELHKYEKDLTSYQFDLLRATIKNRDITKEAKKVLSKSPIDHKKIGRLLNEHQSVLRDSLKISTPKIDKMIEASLKIGALGAKINGSGGGGCMFAYVPNNPEAVAEAIEKEGGKAYIIYPDKGTEVMTIGDGE